MCLICRLFILTAWVKEKVNAMMRDREKQRQSWSGVNTSARADGESRRRFGFTAPALDREKKHTHTKIQSSRWLPLLLGYNNLARLNVAVCVCGCVYHKTSLCTRCDDLMCTNGTNVGILEFSVCVRAYVCVWWVCHYFFFNVWGLMASCDLGRIQSG